MNTQTFDLHIRFTVSLDVGEATVTAVAATPVADEPTVDPATPATGGGPAKPPRTKREKDKPATTPTLTVVPPVTPPAPDAKVGGEGGEQQTLTGDNGVQPNADGSP